MKTYRVEPHMGKSLLTVELTVTDISKILAGDTIFDNNVEVVIDRRLVLPEHIELDIYPGPIQEDEKGPGWTDSALMIIFLLLFAAPAMAEGGFNGFSSSIIGLAGCSWTKEGSRLRYSCPVLTERKAITEADFIILRPWLHEIPVKKPCRKEVTK